MSVPEEGEARGGNAVSGQSRLGTIWAELLDSHGFVR